MRGGTKSAPGVRHPCRSMYMRQLDGRGKNQQQDTAQSKGHPPGTSCVLCGSLTMHPFNYNLTLPGRRKALVHGVKKRLSQCPRNCLFPPAQRLEDKFHYLPC